MPAFACLPYVHAALIVAQPRREGRVQEIANQLLDAAAAHDRIDLIAALGYPPPVNVIAGMLGVTTEDIDWFEG